MRRRGFLTSLVSVAACKAVASAGGETSDAEVASSAPRPRRAYADVVAGIEVRRKKLATKLGGDAASVLVEARATVKGAIVDELFPAWLGTAWAFHGTATEPHGEGGIACGYFVATILQHAGLKLSSRTRFGQAAALGIQRALTPDPAALHRVFSVAATELERRIRALGEGIYVIGLDIHVGFVVVRRESVRFVHASYTGDRLVTDEPLVDAEAIHASRKAGYFITPLFEDERLVRAWLSGTSIAAPPRG